MSGPAHVSSDILHTLMDGLQNCSSSVAALRGAVRGHINQCHNSAKSIVSRLKAIEDTARQHYECCSAAYYSCLRRRKYDEESGEYRPSCSCEERDMKNADDELYKARCAREQAELRLKNMEYEISIYSQSTGGEGTMNSITDDYVPQATNRLMALDNKVQRYEALEIAGIDVGDSTSSLPSVNAPQTKAAEFGRGAERLKSLAEKGQRDFVTRAICSHCGKYPCECGNERELQRLTLREMIMSRTR